MNVGAFRERLGNPMTTIASDGVTVSADGRMTSGLTLVQDDTVKMVVRNGIIFAVSGLAAHVGPLVGWYLAGAVPADYPCPTDDQNSSGFVAIEGPSRVRRFSYGSKFSTDEKFPFVLGSGGDYAMAAMVCGKTPQEAIEIAAMFDLGTGGKIQTIDIAEATKPTLPKFKEITNDDDWAAINKFNAGHR